MGLHISNRKLAATQIQNLETKGQFVGRKEIRFKSTFARVYNP